MAMILASGAKIIICSSLFRNVFVLKWNVQIVYFCKDHVYIPYNRVSEGLSMISWFTDKSLLSRYVHIYRWVNKWIFGTVFSYILDFQTEQVFNINIQCHGPLVRYVELRVAHALGMPGTFSPPPRSRHASRHVRHARAMMHAGIAN